MVPFSYSSGHLMVFTYHQSESIYVARVRLKKSPSFEKTCQISLSRRLPSLTVGSSNPLKKSLSHLKNELSTSRLNLPLKPTNPVKKERSKFGSPTMPVNHLKARRSCLSMTSPWNIFPVVPMFQIFRNFSGSGAAITILAMNPI